MFTTCQVLCSVPYFRRNNSKHTEIFSAEDTKMNESKSVPLGRLQSIRTLWCIIIICKTYILIEHMIRIPPVHNSEDQQVLQTGALYIPYGRLGHHS